MIEFRLRENAGLRRFSYPVRARFESKATPAKLRLLEAGKPVGAQFTEVGPGELEVDFNSSLMPWETRTCRIEEGTSASPRDSMQVDDTGTSWVVKHPGNLSFTVPKNLSGFLNSVSAGDLAYVRPDSYGLGLTYRDDIPFRAGGTNHWGVETKSAVVKQGPYACQLQFAGREGLRGNREVESFVEMHFPRSKSWVEVNWTLNDSENFVSAMSAEMDLLLDTGRTLVDFGTDTAVYAALRPDQSASFQGAFRRSDSGYDWSVEVGSQPYAAGRSTRLEGWAHVMDSRRATAIAFADFARYPATEDRIEVAASGKTRLSRRTGGLRKTLRFWLHFVTMPVQVGAATSPQSMQNPLLVDWL